MTCFYPLEAYQHVYSGSTGKKEIKFYVHPRRRGDYLPIKLPCGQCIGCRLERSRQWAIRCAHEASLYENNCFITLTFNDDHLPENRSVDVRDFQLFMKRLRKRYGSKIRFYHCGEYGDQFGRPHYHACLFNHDFADKKFWKNANGNILYTSAALEELWPFGFSSIGEVTFQSAAYVARYIMKKVTGNAAAEHYQTINLETGEIFDRKPEYTTMSRRPGIGRGWLEKYLSDVYPGDFVVLNEKKMKPPKYYDNQFEILYPYEMDALKESRYEKAEKHAHNNTPERLHAREQVQFARLKMLPRPVE